MKSVGETMAIGRTFKESLQKALRGLETGRFGLGCDRKDRWGTPQQPTMDEIMAKLATPNAERVWYIRYALQGRADDRGDPPAHQDRPAGSCTTSRELVEMEDRLRAVPEPGRRPTTSCCCEAKQNGFSDRQLATLWNTDRDRGSPRAQGARDRAGLQAGRHLRRRVRGVHAVLLLDLRTPSSGETRGASRIEDETRPSRRQGSHHDPGRRPQPHRPGDRVRLLLLPGRVRPAARPASKSSWSTRTRRPSAPTTTPPTTSSSSR